MQTPITLRACSNRVAVRGRVPEPLPTTTHRASPPRLPYVCRPLKCAQTSASRGRCYSTRGSRPRLGGRGRSTRASALRARCREMCRARESPPPARSAAPKCAESCGATPSCSWWEARHKARHRSRQSAKCSSPSRAPLASAGGSNRRRGSSPRTPLGGRSIATRS